MHVQNTFLNACCLLLCGVSAESLGHVHPPHHVTVGKLHSTHRLACFMIWCISITHAYLFRPRCTTAYTERVQEVDEAAAAVAAYEAEVAAVNSQREVDLRFALQDLTQLNNQVGAYHGCSPWLHVGAPHGCMRVLPMVACGCSWAHARVGNWARAPVVRLKRSVSSYMPASICMQWELSRWRVCGTAKSVSRCMCLPLLLLSPGTASCSLHRVAVPLSLCHRPVHPCPILHAHTLPTQVVELEDMVRSVGEDPSHSSGPGPATATDQVQRLLGLLAACDAEVVRLQGALGRAHAGLGVGVGDSPVSGGAGTGVAARALLPFSQVDAGVGASVGVGASAGKQQQEVATVAHVERGPSPEPLYPMY
jgi:hypothetical protein